MSTVYWLYQLISYWEIKLRIHYALMGLIQFLLRVSENMLIEIFRSSLHKVQSYINKINETIFNICEYFKTVNLYPQPNLHLAPLALSLSAIKYSVYKIQSHFSFCSNMSCNENKFFRVVQWKHILFACHPSSSTFHLVT